MGACLSGGAVPHLLENADGDEEAFHSRFIEDVVLGEGEFGVVRMVHDMREEQNSGAAPLACKVLRKGVVFKDNTLYSPLKPEVLRGEVEMLRTLQGKNYCLRLVSIYESPKLLYMVTDYCGGGEMMEYLAQQKEDLRTEDVSRIAFQLLSAIDHCARNNVIHRDLKPENIMFTDKEPKAEVRLIDFGSGTMDTKLNNGENEDGLVRHTTFAGTAFYISPEMFQRTYTQRTDVWSAGAVLYVLVAGYPADQLQKAFNILQTSKDRDLRKLPNMPDNMPDSFFELLEGCLTYRHRRRPSAGELLKYEFVQFAKQLQDEDDQLKGEEKLLSLEEVAAAAAATNPTGKDSSILRQSSVSLRGSVVRHNVFLGFKKYERSITTLLAALLTKKELEQLVSILSDRMVKQDETNKGASSVIRNATPNSTASTEVPGQESEHSAGATVEQTPRSLSVIKVSELKDILKKDLNHDLALETMAKLPNSATYDGFAYHVALIMDFAGQNNAKDFMRSGSTRSDHGGRMNRHARKSIRRLVENNDISNNSIQSASSFRDNGSFRKSFTGGSSRKLGGSVTGGNLFGRRSSTPNFKQRRGSAK